jgi:hypothetical protein
MFIVSNLQKIKMLAPRHETQIHSEPPAVGERLARDLEAAHEARTPKTDTHELMATAETESPDAEKVAIHELLSGAHLGRLAMSRASARLAQRRERLAQPESPEQLHKRKLRRAAAFMGMAAAGYVAARYFDLPPIAFTSTAIANRLSKSPNVASSGAPIAPEKQDATFRRIRGLMERRRERKR